MTTPDHVEVTIEDLFADDIVIPLTLPKGHLTMPRAPSAPLAKAGAPGRRELPLAGFVAGGVALVAAVFIGRQLFARFA